MTNNDKAAMIAVDEVESSQKLSKMQNNEQMANMAQEIEVLKEELRQMRNLTKLTMASFPTQLQGPDVGLPPIAPANPTNLSHAQEPPSFQPTAGAIPGYPFSTHNFTVSIHPEMQHIPEAHVTCEIPVPPVYAIEAPDFATSATFKVPYKADQYVGLGKNVQSSEEGSIVAQLESLKIAFRNMQVTRGTESLDYDELYIHPDIDMPVGYKPPKFDVFDEKGDPHAHLRAYCNKLVGVESNEKLRMKLFIRSLSGEALTWYT
ncbi:hypothetical protein P3L10_030003 [Capsicum annuum]